MSSRRNPSAPLHIVIAHPMMLQVESRAGLQGQPEPVSFMLGKLRIEVLRIEDRWFGEDYCYFRIAGSDGASYILCYSAPEQRWELTFYRTSDAADLPPF